MGHEGQEVLIKDTLVFLFAAGIIVPVLRAFKLPTIAGFIFAGVALGPSGFGALAEAFPALTYITISDADAVAPFAELGVLFLLFLLGLELSVAKLWALRRVVFGAGVFQAVVSATVIGGAAYLLGLPATTSVVVGLALGLSSTAIVMQLLVSKKRAATPVGRTALGVLLLQDILVAPILIFVGFAGQDAGDGLAVILLEALVRGVGALALIFFIGRFLLRPAFQLAANAGGRDLLLAIVLLTVVGAAVITASAGLSIALGAFLAGLLVGETEFRHQTEVDLEPFKGLLLGLFFMTVGFGLDMSMILAQWHLVVGGLVAMLVIKAIIAWVAARLFAGGPALATETSFLLAPAGEFAFVILAAAAASGVIEAAPASIITAIVGLSMLLIPATWQLGRWLAGKLEHDAKAAKLPEDFTELTGHFVIAGFGRIGHTLARILEAEQADIVALEANHAKVRRDRKLGRKVIFGDASREEILAHAGIDGAVMVVVTVDNADDAERIVRTCRRLRPQVPILARAQDVDHSVQLYEAGASYVVPDAIEASLQMAVRALENIGYDGEPARDLIAAVRDSEYRKALND